ncbi:protein moonraker-like isoform X2 [Apostichopus japonicus]|uniref:protein moonraker-like isoform X2 n=1 Tax=Stichopus japonicus TaxID=307972 RepID=UPI003AB1A9AA
MNVIHRNTVLSGGAMQYNNQLQFNLNVPSNSANVTTRYQHPGPIIVEKVGGKPGTRPGSQDENLKSSVKLSLASEEKLSWALQLARRDIKNMLHQQRAVIQEDEEKKKKKQNAQVKKKRGKITKKASMYTKNSKLAVGQTSQNVFKKSVKTQTPPTKLVHYSRQGVLSHLPPGSAEKIFMSSTPIKSTEAKRENKGQMEENQTSKEKLSPNSRQTKEINKLRHELKFYVQRIENLTKEVQSSPTRQDEDERDTLRRKVKRAEQTNRSSRLVYSLQQQVRELQEDLKKAGPTKIKHSKRSQILTRLAAAHRGAVRILQAFLQQLPDQVTEKGILPPLYQELGQLIHKLSLCTRQLEVDHNGIPDDIFTIFEKFQTPVKSRHSSGVSGGVRNLSPVSSRRKLEFGKNLFSDQNHQPSVSPLFKEYVPHQQAQHFSPQRRFSPGYGTAQRLRSDVVKQIATPGSPERIAAIKAGLEALMRVEEPNYNKRENSNKTKPLTQKKRPLLRGRKGVLLPSKSKASQSQDNKGRHLTSNAHYQQATKASKLKATEVRTQRNTEEAKPDQKPPWAPPGSPHSSHRSPTQRKLEPEENEGEEEELKRGLPRTKRVLFEDEAEDINNVELTRGELLQRERSERLDDARDFDWLREDDCNERLSYHGSSTQKSKDAESMITEAERRILKRLEPLLEKAEVTDQAGLLSELLLEDVLEDTVQEVEEMKRQNEAERLAGSLENKPTYETMLQTLERMEAEEDRIRRRWKRVSYHDPLTRDVERHDKKVGDELFMGTPLEGDLLERLEEPPVKHTGIHYTTRTAPSGRTIAISDPGMVEYHLVGDDPSQVTDSDSSQVIDGHSRVIGVCRSSLVIGDDSERSPSSSIEEQHSPRQEPLHAWSRSPQSRFKINVPSDVEKSVQENRRIFQNHLKRKSHLEYGEFDPWKLISEVSDDLVDGILQDVAEELTDFSGGFMDALYKAEFEDKTS